MHTDLLVTRGIDLDSDTMTSHERARIALWWHTIRAAELRHIGALSPHGRLLGA